jgi:hypothetical protein
MRSLLPLYGLHPEFTAKVDFPDHFIPQNIIFSALCDNNAVADNKRFGGYFQCIPDIVIGNQYSYSLFGKASDNFLEFKNGFGIDAGEGFVK